MTAFMQGLYWATVVSVAAGCVGALLPRRLSAVARGGVLAAALALVFSSIYLTLRWIAIGHPPIFGTFENTLAAAWFLLVLALAMLRVPALRGTWRVALPWAAVLLGWGLRYRAEPVPLTISEQSLWVDVHAFFAWCAFTPLIVLGSIAALRLIRRGADWDGLRPSSTQTQVIVSAAFVAFTAMMATGSWYLNVLFGTFWQWGIVETVSLITWLLYGMVLHGILFRRWSTNWLMWVLMLLVAPLIVSFFVWSVFPGTFHFFDVPLVRPY